MALASRRSAFRRSASLVLTVVLVTSMLTFTGFGTASAGWTPAMVERLTELDPTVTPQPDNDQEQPDVSADGSTVVFESEADNLASQASTDTDNVYSCDLATGVTTLVSESYLGGASEDDSHDPQVSGDGRYVVFQSDATNLVPNNVNSVSDVFGRDMATNETTLVSQATDGTQGTHDSYGPSVSNDGRYVAFDSYASNLVPSDGNGTTRDIFGRDMATQETTLVSQTSGGGSTNYNSQDADISSGGRYVVYESSATNISPLDGDTYYDIYLFDMQTRETTLVSQPTTGTKPTYGHNYDPSVSANGRYVAFESYSSLSPTDTNSDYDIYVRDLQTGRTTRVSVDLNGNEVDDDSYDPEISDDGRYVTFHCDNRRLVTGDTNDNDDVFRRDLSTNTTERVSLTDDDQQAKGSSSNAALSDDGNVVVFQSYAGDLVAGDWNDERDIFARNVTAGTTVMACRDASAIDYLSGDSEFARISGDGRYVVFHSDAGNLMAGLSGNENRVFLYDRQTDQLELVSVATDGTQGNDCSSKPSVTTDGRYVVFQSGSDNLFPNDLNEHAEIFLRDRVAGTTSRISTRLAGIHPADEDSECANWPQINRTGTHIVYRSAADDIVPNDFNNTTDIFVYDMESGETTRASVTSDGEEADESSHWPTVSDNGRYVAFRSVAENLNTAPVVLCGSGCMAPQIFIRDLKSQTTTLASVSTTGSTGNGGSRWPSLSADGRYVAFQSGADNLVANDFNDYADVFVRDMKTGEMTLCSITTTGSVGNDCSANPAISADGRFVAFRSEASNLVPGDTNRDDDIFVYDMKTGEVTRVSVDVAGRQGNDDSDKPSISADGTYIGFESDAGNLVKGDVIDTHENSQIYVTKRQPDAEGVDRVWGADRYETALAISQENFDAADTVVLATGEDFPDALSASGLAGALDAPLLLTRTNSLPDGIVDEFQRLGTSEVIVIGGTSAVSAAVYATLDSYFDAERIGGVDRYATAAMVADRMADELGAEFSGDAFVVRGDTFPDALAVAPFSYSQGIPILLTQPMTLPAATAGALTDLAIEDVLIAGGINAVYGGVAGQIMGLVPGTVTREAGADRYATAVAVSARGVTEGWADLGFVGMATGENFPDALSGGVASGVNDGVLLLTSSTTLSAPVAGYLTTNADDVTAVQIFGGPAAVDPTVAAAIAAIVD